MESMVAAIRATIGAGIVSVAAVAKILIFDVTAARPAIRVKLSRLCSQNCVLPPKPRSLIIESAKSKPYFSAFCTISLLRSKLGMYCGAVSEMSQPLLPIGMKTPMSMSPSPPTERGVRKNPARSNEFGPSRIRTFSALH